MIQMSEISELGIIVFFFIGNHKPFSPKLDNVQSNATVRVVWYFMNIVCVCVCMCV